jgi:polysaccharide pyruvyl transferase WcaK-like protein
MKIGVFGYYKFGNFGDDLMALLFSDHLLEQGHQVRVYGLKPSVSRTAGIETVDDIGALVAWSDRLVYGGGGILLDVGANRRIERDLDELIDCKVSKGIPLYAISIGGDGSSTYDGLSESQRRLLAESDFITFRSPEDRRLAESADLDRFEIFPDLVWTVGRWTQPTRENVVSLEFSATRSRIGYYLLVALARVASRDRFVDVVLQHRNSTTRSLNDWIRSRLFRTKVYEDIADMTRFAQRSRRIVTSRLHFGMVGLASGAETFLIHPAGKSRMVFERLGLDEYIIDKASKMAAILHDRKRTEQDAHALSPAQRARIDSEIEQAFGHLQKLDELLESRVRK